MIIGIIIIYICLYECDFLKEFLESVAFLYLLLHKSYIFLFFECSLKLLRKDLKRSLNILLLCLYLSPQGYYSISESVNDKQELLTVSNNVCQLYNQLG